jgi:hypothetical protein
VDPIKPSGKNSPYAVWLALHPILGAITMGTTWGVGFTVLRTMSGEPFYFTVPYLLVTVLTSLAFGSTMAIVIRRKSGKPDDDTM